MINKKVFVLAIFLVSLLTISVASATDNVTGDVVGIDDMTEINTLNNDVVVVDDATNRDNSNDDVAHINDLEVDNITNSVTNNPNILRRGESDDEISVNNDESILGSSSPAFGSWTLFSVSGIIFIATIILAIIYNVKLDDIVDSYGDGCRRIGKTVLLVFFSYIVLETLILPG